MGNLLGEVGWYARIGREGTNSIVCNTEGYCLTRADDMNGSVRAPCSELRMLETIRCDHARDGLDCWGLREMHAQGCEPKEKSYPEGE